MLSPAVILAAVATGTFGSGYVLPWWLRKRKGALALSVVSAEIGWEQEISGTVAVCGRKPLSSRALTLRLIARGARGYRLFTSSKEIQGAHFYSAGEEVHIPFSLAAPRKEETDYPTLLNSPGTSWRLQARPRLSNLDLSTACRIYVGRPAPFKIVRLGDVVSPGETDA